MPSQTVARRTVAQGNANAASPAKANTPQSVLPFVIGSRNASRFSFTTGTTTLGSGIVPLSPIQIPAVGYLKSITLDITLTGTGGTTPAFTADAPFNLLSLVELRNSAGNDLIVPMDGYHYAMLQKWGVQDIDAPASDPRADDTYTATAPSAHFMLQIPCEIAPWDQFGAIPALASNRSYQLALSLNSIANIMSGAPTATVTINGYANYWTEPVATTQNGVNQQSAPPFNGSLNLWQIEQIPVTPGDKYVKSNNVGNVLRTLIFILRNSSGAREDTDWPAVCELYLDNQPMFYLPKAQWQSWMSRTYNFTASPGTRDARGTLDTGVYVVPFFALAEGSAIANARRAQYLPTLDASLLQIRGTSFGSGASTLEIVTNSVVPVNPSTGSPSSALYAL